MIGNFVLKIKHIYAEYALQSPFAWNDEIRLFVLEKQSLCPEYGVHDAATEVIRELSFDPKSICCKYRHETWLAPKVLVPKPWGNNLL